MLDLAKCLLKLNPELARLPDVWDRTPLHYAAAYSRPALAAQLLQEKDNLPMLRLRDCNGFSPLAVATYWKHLPVVQRMVVGGSQMGGHKWGWQMYKSSRCGYKMFCKPSVH